MTAGRVSCSWVRQRLERFLDEELSSTDAALFRSHLMECRECRKPLSPMVRSRRALRAEVPVDDLPLGAGSATRPDRRFFTTMHRAIMARVRGLPVPGLRSPLWRVGAGLAAAALFLVGLTAARLLDPPAAGPSANLLQRDPIEAATPSPDELSLVVTVGHRPSWGLDGRLRARRCLEFAQDPPGGSRSRVRSSAPGPGKRP